MSRFGLYCADVAVPAGTKITIPVAAVPTTAGGKGWVIVWELYRPLDGSMPTRSAPTQYALKDLPYPFPFQSNNKGLHTWTFLAWDKGGPPVLHKPRSFFHRTYSILVQ
jgi:hypothetical protein